MLIMDFIKIDISLFILCEGVWALVEVNLQESVLSFHDRRNDQA